MINRRREAREDYDRERRFTSREQKVVQRDNTESSIETLRALVPSTLHLPDTRLTNHDGNLHSRAKFALDFLRSSRRRFSTSLSTPYSTSDLASTLQHARCAQQLSCTSPGPIIWVQSSTARGSHGCSGAALTPSYIQILLTGASGFLAAHVGQQLLQRGYRVRGTVRSAEKGEYLKQLYKKDGIEGFEYVIVEDVEQVRSQQLARARCLHLQFKLIALHNLQDGAFDKAVIGVDGIAHTASPFHFKVEDPHKDLINPAVKGTTGILHSALLEPKVQRIVITSS